MIRIATALAMVGAVLTLAACGGSPAPKAASAASTHSATASSTPAVTVSPAPSPLTCSTMTGDNGMTATQVIATLVHDQKSQDASQTQGWVDLVSGSQTSQGGDLAAAASALGSYASTQVAADSSTFATDANTFLTDQSGGLMPGWVSEYRAVQYDIAKLAADCGVSYTVPAGE
jgi:hypothetical protein